MILDIENIRLFQDSTILPIPPGRPTMLPNVTQPQIPPAPPASSDLLPCPFCGHEARLSDHALFNYGARQTAWHVECQNYGECEAALTGFASKEAAIAKWNNRHLAPVLLAFYNEVRDQAGRNMAATDTVSGAHWNAMRQVLKAKGVEVNR